MEKIEYRCTSFDCFGSLFVCKLVSLVKLSWKIMLYLKHVNYIRSLSLLL